MPHGIRLLVSGDHACFTRPEMKVERVSYDVMTPSAARGILEAIHWKPAIRWIIDEIHVLKPIRFQSIRRNEIADKMLASNAKTAMNKGDLAGLELVIEDNRQQRAATVLTHAAYVIVAHFEMTRDAGEEDNAAKHIDTFTRRARKGQCFHQPCLGTREFPARFSLVEHDQPLPKAEEQSPQLGFGSPRDLGFMLHDIDHGGDRSSMFFRATLTDGVMKIPQPGSPEICR